MNVCWIAFATCIYICPCIGIQKWSELQSNTLVLYNISTFSFNIFKLGPIWLLNKIYVSLSDATFAIYACIVHYTSLSTRVSNVFVKNIIYFSIKFDPSATSLAWFRSNLKMSNKQRPYTRTRDNIRDKNWKPYFRPYSMSQWDKVVSRISDVGSHRS